MFICYGYSLCCDVSGVCVYVVYVVMNVYFFFFKQKTAYEMRISDWSSDVCSSDLPCSSGTPVAGPRGGRTPGVRPGGGVPRRGRAGRRRDGAGGRSEERRVGKECVSTGRSRWAQ